MGFYIRKSISAGPFRFNLSGSGMGMSVGVKGFRVGRGPRGNYVHMGRGGLYYRASLGGRCSSGRTAADDVGNVQPPSVVPSWNIGVQLVEIGNVLNMVPANGSEIVKEINEKLSLWRSWPWVLVAGLWLSAMLNGQPGAQWTVIPALFLTTLVTLSAARWDQTRKTVVIMYDIDDDTILPFRAFSEEIERLGSAKQIWNVDTAQNTDDWKRNAGAGQLLTRKPVSVEYGTPSIIKTNVSIPSITGGKHNVYFFPDIVLVMEGKTVGALTYEQFGVVWGTTVFIEDGAVPSDTQIVGQTWRFVNKKGGPDRRFNNNRQLPKVIYQHMGLAGTGSFRKLLHISRVEDRSSFDSALNRLRGTVQKQNLLALEAPQRG